MYLKCPFAAPITSASLTCRHAQEVVRRGGSEYDCRSAPDHERCQRLFESLKAVALPAFGVEDDPTSMPHSVLVKIQHGGLLGLRRLLGPGGGQAEDIVGLVARAAAVFGSPDAIPCGDLASDITGFKLERRRRGG